MTSKIQPYFELKDINKNLFVFVKFSIKAVRLIMAFLQPVLHIFWQRYSLIIIQRHYNLHKVFNFIIPLNNIILHCTWMLQRKTPFAVMSFFRYCHYQMKKVSRIDNLNSLIDKSSFVRLSSLLFAKCLLQKLNGRKTSGTCFEINQSRKIQIRNKLKWKLLKRQRCHFRSSLSVQSKDQINAPFPLFLYMHAQNRLKIIDTWKIALSISFKLVIVRC